MDEDIDKETEAFEEAEIGGKVKVKIKDLERFNIQVLYGRQNISVHQILLFSFGSLLVKHPIIGLPFTYCFAD